jgi:hypothetical protein
MFLLKKASYSSTDGSIEMPIEFDYSKWRNFNDKTKLVLLNIFHLKKEDKLIDIQGIYVAVRSSASPDYDSLYESNLLQTDKVSPNIFFKKINASLASNIATFLDVNGPTYTYMDPEKKVKQVFRQSLIDSLDFGIHYSLIIIEESELSFLFYIMKNNIEMNDIKIEVNKRMEIYYEDRK